MGISSGMVVIIIGAALIIIAAASARRQRGDRPTPRGSWIVLAIVLLVIAVLGGTLAMRHGG